MVLWMGHKTEMKLEQWGTPTIKQGVLNMRKNSLVYPLILHSISYSTVGCSTKQKNCTTVSHYSCRWLHSCQLLWQRLKYKQSKIRAEEAVIPKPNSTGWIKLTLQFPQYSQKNHLHFMRSHFPLAEKRRNVKYKIYLLQKHRGWDCAILKYDFPPVSSFQVSHVSFHKVSPDKEPKVLAFSP